jgi:S-adenosylmethionine:tRNA ribosyltransferase-isomerase
MPGAAVYAIGALDNMRAIMRRQDFHFDLPPELIAQQPAVERSASRLLLLDGASGALSDQRFRSLPELLRPQDLLIFNDTRVIPARVFGQKSSGGRVELLLERALGPDTALVQARASKSLKPQAVISLPGGHTARVLGREGDLFHLEFSCEVLGFFEAQGQMPLPPYIARNPEGPDRERYQTVYARAPGAVAAPTAGLHFDADVFTRLRERGIAHTFITLHVGAGTFQPLREDDIDAHVMHAELAEVTPEVCSAIEAARAAGGRIVAVGTTVVRSLESAAAKGQLEPFHGDTRIFIKPGYRFRVVDALVTNFHLPESTLLMLCAAFVGRERLLAAYAHAVAARYRFFSYGDAMLLTPMPEALDRPAQLGSSEST